MGEGVPVYDQASAEETWAAYRADGRPACERQFRRIAASAIDWRNPEAVAAATARAAAKVAAGDGAAADVPAVEVLVHNNGVAVVALRVDHPARAALPIRVDFAAVDRLREASAEERTRCLAPRRSKHAGLLLRPTSVLCTILCADGSSFMVRAGVDGKLLELNERLAAEPALAAAEFGSGGWLCIILPTERGKELLGIAGEDDAPDEAEDE
jgi:hypothetical protein